MGNDERIAELFRERDWRAVLTILQSRLFERDSRVWDHVDLIKRDIDFHRILEDATFSGGERRLLRIAASLFSTWMEINLWHELGGLDEEHTTVALRAISAYCGTEWKRG